MQLGGRAVYLAGQRDRARQRESVPDVARNLSRWVRRASRRACSRTPRVARWPPRDVPVINGLSRSRASLPGAGRLLHAVGARRRPRGHARRLHRRRQQRRATRDAAAARCSASTSWSRARPATSPTRACWPPCAQLRRHGVDGHHDAARGGRRRRRRSTPTSGPAWARRPSASSACEAFRRYQVNDRADGVRQARGALRDALPARPSRRGDHRRRCSTGRASIVLDQAENRLHAQKAMICRAAGEGTLQDGSDHERAKKVVLAYSGGLDTSVILALADRDLPLRGRRLLRRPRAGRGARPGRATRRSETGAGDVHIDDLREEFVRDFVFPMLRANAVYEGTLPARHLDRAAADRQAQVEVARQEGADAVAPRRHRQGQRPGPLRADLRRARARADA